MSNNGLALEYASDAMQDNKEVVLAAVSNNGLALEYASKFMQNNMAVVMAAVSNNGKAFKYASGEMHMNMDVHDARLGFFLIGYSKSAAAYHGSARSFPLALGFHIGSDRSEIV